MKKPFEACLAFIENELGVQLLDWQKTVLRNEYEDKHCCYHFGRISGKYILCEAARRLKELMEEENHND